MKSSRCASGIAVLEQQLATRDDLIHKLEHNVEVSHGIAFGRGRACATGSSRRR